MNCNKRFSKGSHKFSSRTLYTLHDTSPEPGITYGQHVSPVCFLICGRKSLSPRTLSHPCLHSVICNIPGLRQLQTKFWRGPRLSWVQAHTAHALTWAQILNSAKIILATDFRRRQTELGLVGDRIRFFMKRLSHLTCHDNLRPTSDPEIMSESHLLICGFDVILTFINVSKSTFSNT